MSRTQAQLLENCRDNVMHRCCVANVPLVNIDVTDDYNNLTKAINNYNNTQV